MPAIMKEYGLTKEQKERLGVSESNSKSSPSNTSAADSPGCGSLGASPDMHSGIEFERLLIKHYGNIGLGQPSTTTASTGTTNETKDYGDIGLGRPSTTTTTTTTTTKDYGDIGLGRPSAPATTTTPATHSKKSAPIGLGLRLPSAHGVGRNTRINHRQRRTSTFIKTTKFANRRLFTIPEEGSEAFKFSPRLQ